MGWTFLIDTGADVSIIPAKYLRKKPIPTTFELYAANGERIKTYGERFLTLNLGLRHPIKWTFVFADVSRPVIGADFLTHNKLIVDFTGKRLIDGTTKLTVLATCRQVEYVTAMTVDPGDEYHRLLTEFPGLTRPLKTPSTQAHGIFHHIETKGPPVSCRPRRLPPEKLKIAKAEFVQLLETGICRPS